MRVSETIRRRAAVRRSRRGRRCGKVIDAMLLTGRGNEQAQRLELDVGQG